MSASYYSNPFQNSDSPSSSAEIVPESSWESGSFNGRVNFSDGEVMLASDNPKKRAGRKKFRETRHPVYRGVRQRGSGKWVCEMREPNKKARIWLGTFPTPEMAARAHDVAAMALRGRSACLNFADSAWRLPIPASADTKDIQKTAVLAANAFRPKSAESGGEADVASPENLFFLDEEAADVASPQKLVFMDDEALFGMHDLVSDMAHGLMLPPPQYSDYVEMDAELQLWSYSF